MACTGLTLASFCSICTFPKYDGVAILQAIKQAPVLAHIHVIVLSGMASPAEKDKIANMGASYRQKPFGLQ